MAIRIDEFDLWRAGYGGATVKVWNAGTTTLSSIYTDEALSVPAANPQTLSSQTIGGVTYGKFDAPLYIGVDYQLNVNLTETTGVRRLPIASLTAVSASAATARATSGSTDPALSTVLARSVWVRDYGVFLPTNDGAASAATNTTTLNSAIGVASALGGGTVMLPAGTFAHNAIPHAANVVVLGSGKTATVLQCTAGSAVWTMAGASGFEDITLDGVSKTASSKGVYSAAKDRISFKNVLIKRFAIGLNVDGALGCDWENLDIDNCAVGAHLYGNSAGSGAEFWYNRWNGGEVSNCTTIGIDLEYTDKKVWHNTFDHIGFISNVIGLTVVGARHTELGKKCWFTGNTTDITIADAAAATAANGNTVVGFKVSGGKISANMTLGGTCQDVIFEEVYFASGTYTLTSVTNAIVAVDCLEASAVALAGTSASKWMRQRRIVDDSPGPSGITTDGSATEAWAYTLEPGERVIVEAKVIGNSRNSDAYATYHIERAAHRPGSTLDYQTQTANFTLGTIVTGATSGASGRIIVDSDAGATGTLTLRDISGAFVNGEAITDTGGGAAVTNGTLAHQNAALLDAGLTSIKPASETVGAWDAVIGVSGANVRVVVTGAAATTVEWTVAVSVTSG